MKGLGNSLHILAPVILAGILLSASSCKKAKTYNLGPDLNVANDIVITQRIVVNTFRMLVRAAADPALTQTHQAFFDGASVIYNPALEKYTFFYYGIYSPDSVLRSGSIEAVLSGDLFASGTRAEIRFLDYSEDGMPVTGTDSVFNTGPSATGLTFENRVSSGLVIKDTVGTIAFSAGFAFTLDPPLPPDAAASMLVTGNLDGVSSKGFPFSATISDPLESAVYTGVCPWTRSGLMVVSMSNSTGNADGIYFPEPSSCNDSVYYDFGVTTYKWRMKPKYLSH